MPDRVLIIFTRSAIERLLQWGVRSSTRHTCRCSPRLGMVPAQRCHQSRICLLFSVARRGRILSIRRYIIRRWVVNVDSIILLLQNGAGRPSILITTPYILQNQRNLKHYRISLAADDSINEDRLIENHTYYINTLNRTYKISKRQFDILLIPYQSGHQL